MRMWLVPPEILCTAHLLGAHKEVHTGEYYLIHGEYTRLQGHEQLGQFDISMLIYEHDTLAEELTRRGYRHSTPLNVNTELLVDMYITFNGNIQVNIKHNLTDLTSRCTECSARYEMYKRGEFIW